MGVSALICALVIGKRRGYGKVPMPPHSVVLSVIGAALLWVGWFGFNGGSALAANGLASSAFIATHFAAAAATLGWMFVEWLKSGKPTVLGAISGAVAGLVVITPASGFTTPMYAIIMGFIGGAVCFFSATTLKHMFGYDDSLDAFGVHGVGGTVGALLTGVFAVAAINTGINNGKGIWRRGRRASSLTRSSASSWRPLLDVRNRHRRLICDPPNHPPPHRRIASVGIRRIRWPGSHPARRKWIQFRGILPGDDGGRRRADADASSA